MRHETRTLYPFTELRPEAQAAAIETERKRRERNPDIPWMEETIASYRAILDAIGATLDRDGDPRPMRDSDIGNLQGPRAMAWAENHLVAPLRIPWKGPKRDEVRKYGAGYRPGQIRPCPWTGFYADDAFLQAFLDAIKSGDSIDEALQAILVEYRRIVDAEQARYFGEEGIREDLEAWDHIEYLEYGKEA